MQSNNKNLKNLNRYNVIIWDFDGVIINSSKIRVNAFRESLKEYPLEMVEELIKYHKENDGLSRYVKLDYFFSNIINKKLDAKLRENLLEKYGLICSKELNNNLLIRETIDYIMSNPKKDFHIASGSDNTELNVLCKNFGINKYFKTINGSPEHKNNIVNRIIDDFKYDKDSCCLIGDSINDYDAAMINGIYFFGYNNLKLKNLEKSLYISNF